MSYRIVLKETSELSLYCIQTNRIYKIFPWFWHTASEKVRTECFTLKEASENLEKIIKPKEKPVITVLKRY